MKIVSPIFAIDMYDTMVQILANGNVQQKFIRFRTGELLIASESLAKCTAQSSGTATRKGIMQ